jgi:hypothetical protein
MLDGDERHQCDSFSADELLDVSMVAADVHVQRV